MAGVEHVHLSLRHIAAIGFRLRKLERLIILPPDNQQARLLLAHPPLPLRVRVDVRAVVVEEIALNVGLAGLAEKGKFVGPKIRVITFHLGILSATAWSRRGERQEAWGERRFAA